MSRCVLKNHCERITDRKTICRFVANITVEFESGNQIYKWKRPISKKHGEPIFKYKGDYYKATVISYAIWCGGVPVGSSVLSRGSYNLHPSNLVLMHTAQEK